ncbi:uncharacterized protein LOC109515075 isoform X2 [Hippocampus comes]|uniref:uncharacterized protein LOC109515075 isoform X2 n=1 Tax=Hippocampus comes TaxID=109280 RepID=UPI00094F24D9|nr:PREDICTED: uncharacterized protein LOC109515075 isoform X2 [Hippocampus comes]
MLKLCVFWVALFRAHGSVLFASLGDHVTLPCNFAPDAKYLCWYKQVAGDKPQIVFSFYVYALNSHSHQMATEFNKRMIIHAGQNSFHLNISNVQLSDTAMYYCGQSRLNVMSFDSGIFLLVKESTRLSVLQHPTSITESPGGSATMNCTMHPGSSDGVHTVYWFRKASGDSHLLYVHSESSSGCATASEKGCVYMLSKRDVAMSDAGTYYCAVASCGEIVFGKGTCLEIDDKTLTDRVLTYCVRASLLVSFGVNVFLMHLLIKRSRRDDLVQGDTQDLMGFFFVILGHGEGNCHLILLTGKIPQPSDPEDNRDDESEDAAALPYVALDFKKRQSNSRRHRGPDDSVYSGLRLQQVD